MYPWFPDTFHQEVTGFKNGVIPLQPCHEQHEVSWDDLAPEMPPSLKFLAVRQKTHVPYTPVSNGLEEKLYMKYVSSITTLKIDFKKMASDWNTKLCHSQSVQLCKNFFFKTSFELESFYKSSVTKMDQRLKWIDVQPQLSQLREMISAQVVSVDIGVGESQSIIGIKMYCAFPDCASPDANHLKNGYAFCVEHQSFAPFVLQTRLISQSTEYLPSTLPISLPSNNSPPIPSIRLRNIISQVPVPGMPSTTVRGPSYSGTLDFQYPNQVQMAEKRRARTCNNCKKTGCYGMTKHGGKGVKCGLAGTNLPENACLFKCNQGLQTGADRCNGGYVNICKVRGQIFSD